MKDSFNLASGFARTYRIARGSSEDETVWVTRAVYSVLGQTALASLWDLHEDELPTSIVRFKECIRHAKESFLDLYPVIGQYLSDEHWNADSPLEEEIYNLYLGSGFCYKSPYRLTPVVRRAASEKDCTLLRGNAVGEKFFVSGLGPYRPRSQEQGDITISEMFRLSTLHLTQIWQHASISKQWAAADEEDHLEFLRLRSPFSQGYWQNKADKKGDVSLARTTMEGEKRYYLYKIENNRLLLSQLPEWQVSSPDWMADKGAYRNLSNACLYAQGTLPSTLYRCDGPIVYLQMQYLLPPAEQNLIRLYSWPDFANHQYTFRRVMDADVFQTIKTTLEKTGYRFEEE